MENPFSADKSSPFLTPYQAPAAPDPAPGIKPFAAVDLAPPAGQNGNRHSAPAPQASPFLGKGDFSNAFLSNEASAASRPAPASPAQPAPVASPTLPAASLAKAFSPTPTPASAVVPPFPAKHTVAPQPADFTPVPEPSLARVERTAPPAPAMPAAAAAPSAPPSPAATLPPPRRGTGTEALAKSTLQMTDADAPAPAPAPAKPGLLITTGPSVDGRRIVSYLGVVSVEIVIPKDVLFRNPAPYGELHRIKAAEDQLQRVKQKAFEELADRARALGADGIVGATLQFSQFDAVVFLCAAAGTAVKFSDP